MRGGLLQLGQSITRRASQADKKAVGRRFFASEASLKKTALFEFHQENGGKMVPLAGWSMPIQYKDLEHIENHMKPFKAKGGDVSWKIHDDRSLLAVQGPLAASSVQPLTDVDLSKVYFGDFKMMNINGAPCYLTRTGYTGEDGFEISVPSDHAVDLAKAILNASDGKIRLTGLGARDSLRLEAGLCLYGNDLEQHLTPVEAGLTWAIGKRRRAEADFLGAETILKQIKEGPLVKRCGFISTGPPPRSHCEIKDGEVNLGEVTSGGFSPCLQKNIGMGYVTSKFSKAGTEFKILIRGKMYDATVTKMPFVPAKYYKPFEDDCGSVEVVKVSLLLI